MNNKKIEDLNILVVGDIMLDKYVYGNVNRISPESPTPLVEVTKEYYTLGGCGNVVRNLREIGAQVDCLASVAIDLNGEKIKDLLHKLNVGNIVLYESQQTTVKQRIIATNNNAQILRIDKEVIKKIDPHIAISTFEINKKDKYDIIIVSDYAKGMITKELITHFRNLKNQPKIIVDPKPINGFIYKDVYMVTPNEKEWVTMQLSQAYTLPGIEYVLETKGSKGMVLHDKNKSFEIKSESKDVFNVSGAGDTVIAVMGTCLSLDLNPKQAAQIANKCAGYVVTKPGTSTIPKEKFNQYFQEVINQ